MNGPVARDSTGNRMDALYEGGVAFYLDGPGASFSRGEVNRATHLAGGHLRSELSGLQSSYSVELWFQNLLPSDARPVTGYLLSMGADRIAIGGTERAPGKLLVVSGGNSFEGVTPLAARAWNHLVFVRDGPAFHLFLNGRPEISGSNPSPAPLRQVTLGAVDNDRFTFEGKLDEISIFPRALPASEVTAHFAAARLFRTGG